MAVARDRFVTDPVTGCDQANQPLSAPQFVVARLEAAGMTLLSLPETGYSTRLQSSSLDFVRATIESYGWSQSQVRPPSPSSSAITRMDETLQWILLIPRETYVLRRIVGARCLISPLTERHLFPWRRLATALGADHKAVQRWHAQAVDVIVAKLRAGGFNFPP